MPARADAAELAEHQPLGRMLAMRLARTDLPCPFSDATISMKVVSAYLLTSARWCEWGARAEQGGVRARSNGVVYISNA